MRSKEQNPPVVNLLGPYSTLSDKPETNDQSKSTNISTFQIEDPQNADSKNKLNVSNVQIIRDLNHKLKISIIVLVVVAAILFLSVGIGVGFSHQSPSKKSNQSEKDVLLIFKNAIYDPQLLGSWQGDDPCAGWNGITCDGNSVSIVQYPYSTNADTSIPPEFSQLKNLKQILFNYDGITGTIPPELSVLDIQQFEIKKQEMRGSLPVQLSTWKNIEYFNLDASSSRGALTGPLPEQYSTWKNLKKFNIDNNQLSSTLPVQLSTWYSNAYVKISDNEFTGTVPEEYSIWNSYLDLYLSPQRLNSLCISSKLVNNLYSSVYSTDINELPVCYSSDTNTNSNSNSNFSDQINALLKFRNSIKNPGDLSSWTGSNPCFGWVGVTCINGEITVIEYKNQASSSIPPEFSILKSLKKFDFSGAQITGTIPPELSTFKYLKQFQLDRHRLTGSLPPELSNWENIQYFVPGSSLSSWTGLTGPLPKQYSTWKNIKIFQISDNLLSGSVPEQYSTWTNFSNLYLSPQDSDKLCISSSLESMVLLQQQKTDVDELPNC